jgi:hypothetical protein
MEDNRQPSFGIEHVFSGGLACSLDTTLTELRRLLRHKLGTLCVRLLLQTRYITPNNNKWRPSYFAVTLHESIFKNFKEKSMMLHLLLSHYCEVT